MKGGKGVDKDVEIVLHKIVGMIEDVAKKVDNMQNTMDVMQKDIDAMKKDIDVMKKDIDAIKQEQNEMNDRLDTIASMYGSHEEAIRRLKARKIL